MAYKLNSIAVFCGSGQSADEIYYNDAKRLGKLLAENKITLIYGGSNLGLMKAIADATLDNDGDVIGLIPKVYASEAYEAVKDIRVAETPHERKMMFYDLSDGFIAMPGGFGMMEELFETIKWQNDGIIDKPVGIFNSNQFFSPLLTFLEKTVESGFLKQKNLDGLLQSDDPTELLQAMKNYQPK